MAAIRAFSMSFFLLFSQRVAHEFGPIIPAGRDRANPKFHVVTTVVGRVDPDKFNVKPT
jgi:hypothetical protein